MNVIEKVQEILNNYPQISQFSDGVKIDYTENNPCNYGLFPTGDSLIKEDLLGNQKRHQSFILYAINQSYGNYDKLKNSSFLLELGYWMNAQRNIPIMARIGENEYNGEILNMSCANAMLFEVPTKNINDGVTYQIQINVKYKIVMED